jgi:hypothetical protein
VLGEASTSLETAVTMSMLLHLATGAVVWWRVIPRMPEPMRIPARLGLLAFLVHPIALQTVVHVAQGSEVMGLFFSSLALATAMPFFADGRLVGRAAPKPKVPRTADFVRLSVLAVLALLSKECWFPPLLVLIAAVAWTHRSRAGRNVILALLPILLVGAFANAFSGKEVHNESNYARSRVFRKSVEEGRVVPPADSIMLPVRDRAENLRLQTALVPLIARVTFVPFGLVKDYGYFPYGKRSYSPSLPWFPVGIAMLVLFFGAIAFLWKRATPQVWALVLAPAAYYSVYFVFPVYDPLFLYRLYGVAFLTLVLAVPALTQIGAEAASRDRAVIGVASALAALAIVGGALRTAEMIDPVREAETELARMPDNHRLWVSRLHAWVAEKRFPIDCRAALEPALTLAPSAGLVYIEWAWCASLQKRMDEAREMALLSLEYESVPENVHVAVGILTSGGTTTFDAKKVHPTNYPVLFK